LERSVFYRSFARLCRATLALPIWLLLFVSGTVHAGGPKYVAGTSFFNPGVLGQPMHWAGGQVNYYVDQGPFSSDLSNQQATAMVDAAAALWSAVSTAGVTLTDKGQLNEDVSGANIVVSGTNFTVANEQIGQLGQITQPADVAPSATSYPVGVIFDQDGSVIPFTVTALGPDLTPAGGVTVVYTVTGGTAIQSATATSAIDGTVAFTPHRSPA
jgi:archaellum component FlaF (FlaF/FlaG flagellin family)